MALKRRIHTLIQQHQRADRFALYLSTSKITRQPKFFQQRYRFEAKSGE